MGSTYGCEIYHCTFCHPGYNYSSNLGHDDKVPRQLPANVWSTLVADYQSQKIDGVDKVFQFMSFLVQKKW